MTKREVFDVVISLLVLLDAISFVSFVVSFGIAGASVESLRLFAVFVIMSVVLGLVLLLILRKIARDVHGWE